MPRPCSTDLRERALLACERDGDDCIAVARRFRVGISTLHLWRKQAREEGRRAPLRMGRGPAPLGGKLAVLGQIAAEHRDATLAEHADMLAQRTGETRSAPVICRALKRLGRVRKQRRSGPASRTARTWLPPERRGATKPQTSTRRGSSSSTRAGSTRALSAPGPIARAMGARHARALRGQRAHGTAPGGHWQRLTLIGALGLDGLCCAMTVAAATGTAVFLAFVTQVLIPALSRTRPDAVVVMGNLAAHNKAACVRGALDRAGISYRYLPAYSPDMNPIELTWSKLKTLLRSAGARSCEALDLAIPDALAAITPHNAQGWSRHAGYAPN